MDKILSFFLDIVRLVLICLTHSPSLQKIFLYLAMGVMDTLKAILTRSVLKSNQWQTIRLMLREIQVIDIYRATKTTTGPYTDPLI